MLIGCTGNTKAVELETSLNIIQKDSETMYLENDQGYISKSIIASEPSKGEVIIELKVSNTKKESEQVKDTEIFLVVDNSGSMGYTTSTGEVRRDMIVKAVKQLTNSIFDSSSNVKVGLIRFAGNTVNNTLLTNGSTIMCDLTADKETMLTAIQEFENLNTSVTLEDVVMQHCESGTNIESGLKRANDNFSASCDNKIIILLTDGIPNGDVNNSTTMTRIYNNTKQRLQTIETTGTSIISMMTGITEEADGTNAKEIVSQIFGTPENPTAGKFYNIADANMNTVITTNIFNDVMEKIQNPIHTVKVIDYFPQDITENFTFSYVGEPNIGNRTEGIDSNTNTIQWEIDTLKGEEVATLQYKLTIKDMQNVNLLNKIMATNEKVVLTYKDIEDTNHTVTLMTSPRIQLVDRTAQQDQTTAPGKIPQAGLTAGGGIITLSIISIVIFAKYRKYKNI